MTTERHVWIVDDDEAIRRSAGFMLKTSGYLVRSFVSGDEFLKEANNLEPGCILLDIRLPGLNGLEVQQALLAKGITSPVIIMTGHGDISIAVAAMKAGAVDFIEKPFEKATLIAALEDGFGRIEKSDHHAALAEMASVRLAALTNRECDVLRGLVEGLPNKTIGYDLGISPRTVEIHRANLMSKLDVRSLSEALRIAFAAGWGEEIPAK